MSSCLLNKTIGIIGGGQLGKMMILDAKRLGFHVTILDPTLNCPAHSIADKHLVKSFDDEEAIKELVCSCDIVTYEFEHIAVNTLIDYELKGYNILPSPSILKTIQNKYDQKKFLLDIGLSVPNFFKVESLKNLYNLCETLGYPVVLKTCTGGYDGKGNAIIENKGDIKKAYLSLGEGKIPLMLEEFIPYSKEISILVCKSKDNQICTFPVVENTHINSILYETIAPACLDKETSQNAETIAIKVIEAFNTCGIFCIEMFLTKDGSIFINEIAPRPHNSGHYTIEGCLTSQFAQHIRSIVGLPLGDTSLIKPTVMLNLLGEKNGIATYEGVREALAIKGVNLHIYGKEEVKIGRKMAHITACGEKIEEAKKKAHKAKRHISINTI